MKKTQNVPEWVFTIIKNPFVTEKTARGAEYGQVSFVVSMEATKPQIKRAAELLFDAKVKSVNTLIQKGKTKRFKGVTGRRSDVKKAVVRFDGNQFVDVSSGIL